MDGGCDAGGPELPRGPDRDDWFAHLPPAIPVLKEYSPERRRREEYATLGFITDTHPMQLHEDDLARFRLCPSTELHRHVGGYVLMAGMLTTAKPVHTIKDEPMEFATFDDGHGLIETVLFPRVYRERGHVLFDQGPSLPRESGGGVRRGDGDGHAPRPAGPCGGEDGATALLTGRVSGKRYEGSVRV